MKLRSLLVAAAITLGSSFSGVAAEKDVVDTAVEDIAASNGVIHVIDKVIVPPEG